MVERVRLPIHHGQGFADRACALILERGHLHQPLQHVSGGCDRDDDGGRSLQAAGCPFGAVDHPVGGKLAILLRRTLGVCIGGVTQWTTTSTPVFLKPARCAPASIRVSVGTASGAAGTICYPLRFANIGTVACSVSGITTVQPSTAARENLARVGVGPPARSIDMSSCGDGDPVRLTLGQQASSAFGVSETAKLHAVDLCRKESPEPRYRARGCRRLVAGTRDLGRHEACQHLDLGCRGEGVRRLSHLIYFVDGSNHGGLCKGRAPGDWHVTFPYPRICLMATATRKR
jgi:hypothetical protein